MPALFTHYNFGQDVLKKLDKNEQVSIKSNISYYNMFNQAYDNLYYYPFKWNYYRKFGSRIHNESVTQFFDNIITFIINNNYQENSTLTNMLYGFINHYTLDTIVHPFINSQVKNLNIPHTKLEFLIDAILINDTNFIWHNKFYKTLIPKLKFSKDLNNLINYVFNETYNEENMSKIFNISHNTGYYLYRYFVNDNYNIKKKFYYLIDFIIRSDFKLYQNTFNKNIINLEILNNEKNTWNYRKKEYNYSFQELYNYALNIAIKLNKLAYKVINEKEDKQVLLKEIENISINNWK